MVRLLLLVALLGIRIGDAIHPGPDLDLGFDDPDGPSWHVSEDDCAQNCMEQLVAPGQAGADVRGAMAL